MPTDEDESEPESEEEYELSEKEQRLLHEAYDTYATTGQQWTQERQCENLMVLPSWYYERWLIAYQLSFGGVTYQFGMRSGYSSYLVE